MQTNFKTGFDFTIGQEGGYSNDRNDPGNWTGGKVGKGELKGTNHGIAANTYPNLDIKGLTLADVETIYKRDYWDKVGADFMAAGFDVAAWDYGVNSGNARSLKDVQRVLKIGVDGKLGPETKKAVALATSDDIKALCARRLSFMRALSTWARYGKGWSKRVAAVEAKGVAMWLASAGASATTIRNELRDEAAEAAGKSQSTANTATTTAGGGLGATAGAAGTGNMYILIAAVASVALVAFLIWRSRQHKDRAEAYIAEAAAV